MFCRQCGGEVNESESFCASCGHPVAAADRAAVLQAVAPGKLPNYLVQSILVTLFCCLPFGVVGIVYAAQVNAKLQVGDVAGAQEASRKAKNWSIAGFFVGFLVMLGYFALGFLGALDGSF